MRAGLCGAAEPGTELSGPLRVKRRLPPASRAGPLPGPLPQARLLSGLQAGCTHGADEDPGPQQPAEPTSHTPGRQRSASGRQLVSLTTHETVTFGLYSAR